MFPNTDSTNLANDFVIFINGLNEMELMKGERGFYGYAPVFKIIPFGHNYRTKK